jgi:hypothetical protein
MTRRRWTLSDLNTWHVVAAANLRGLSLAETEARIREMIEALQEEELALRNIGADPANFAALSACAPSMCGCASRRSRTGAQWWRVVGKGCNRP